LDAAHFEPGSEVSGGFVQLTRKLAQTRGKGWERWRELANEPMRGEHVRAVKQIAANCKGKFENLVVLGIGGSALGNIAVQSALNPSTWNLMSSAQRKGAPRLFVIDNVDPALFSQTIAFCEANGGLEKTVFNVISKSGETAETAAQFMIIRDMLKKKLGNAYAANIVAVTDPAKGTMRKICDAEKFVTLPVPDGVGGRFSVLSPVGLFSAAMCGIDIDALLDGAVARLRDRFLAALQHTHHRVESVLHRHDLALEWRHRPALGSRALLSLGGFWGPFIRMANGRTPHA
jgi:glucose-6-phosphate isomerase